MNYQVGNTPSSVMDYQVGIISTFGQTGWSYPIVSVDIYRYRNNITIMSEVCTASFELNVIIFAPLFSTCRVGIGVEGQLHDFKKVLGFGRCKG